MLTARYLIEEIRAQLDQFPLEDEDILTDSAVLGSPSTIFSNENLLERLNQAQRSVVTMVKAQHVPRTIRRYEGPFPELPDDCVRLLRSRVFFSGETTVNNPMASWDPQGYYDGVPAPNSTVYSFVAGRRVHVQGLVVTVDIIPTTPTVMNVMNNDSVMGQIFIDSIGTVDVALPAFYMKMGDVLSVKAGTNNTAGDITMSFTASAEVLLEEQSTGVRCRQRPVSRNRRMEAGGRIGTPEFPVYTFEDGELNIFPATEDAFCFFVSTPKSITLQDFQQGRDELDIDERLEEALIYHVVGSCYQTMRRPDLHVEYMKDFADVIDAYSLNNRANPKFDDREVDIE